MFSFCTGKVMLIAQLQHHPKDAFSWTSDSSSGRTSQGEKKKKRPFTQLCLCIPYLCNSSCSRNNSEETNGDNCCDPFIGYFSTNPNSDYSASSNSDISRLMEFWFQFWSEIVIWIRKKNIWFILFTTPSLDLLTTIQLCPSWKEGYQIELDILFLAECLGIMASLLAQTVKNLPTMQGPGLDLWVGKIPQRGEWQPSPVFLPGESHGLGAWRTTVHGVTKHRTRLRDWAHVHSLK